MVLSTCGVAFLPASHFPSCKHMQDYLRTPISLLLWGTTAIKTWLPTQPGQLLCSWSWDFLSPAAAPGPEGITNSRKASIDPGPWGSPRGRNGSSPHRLNQHHRMASCPLHHLQLSDLLFSQQQRWQQDRNVEHKIQDKRVWGKADRGLLC